MFASRENIVLGWRKKNPRMQVGHTRSQKVTPTRRRCHGYSRPRATPCRRAPTWSRRPGDWAVRSRSSWSRPPPPEAATAAEGEQAACINHRNSTTTLFSEVQSSHARYGPKGAHMEWPPSDTSAFRPRQDAQLLSAFRAKVDIALGV